MHDILFENWSTNEICVFLCMRATPYSDITVKLSSLERHRISICMYDPPVGSLVIRPSCSGSAIQIHTPGVQVLTSVLVWSSRWKEERSIWALLAHRWPKALLYHSGDLPLQYKQQTMHIFHLQWGPEPPVWEHLISAHTWGPLWRCVWAWSWQSHRAPGGTDTPAPPLSPPQWVGCHHARQIRTLARRSLYTGLCAMICSRARSKPPHNKHKHSVVYSSNQHLKMNYSANTVNIYLLDIYFYIDIIYFNQA